MTTLDDTVRYMRYRSNVTTNSCINTRGDLLSRLINEHTCTRNVADNDGASAEQYIIDVGTGGLWDTRNITGLYLKFLITLENVPLDTTAHAANAAVNAEVNINDILNGLGNSAFCIDSVEVENSKYKVRDQNVYTTSRIYQQMLPKEFLQMYPHTFASTFNKPVKYPGICTTANAAGAEGGKAKVENMPLELFIPVWMLHSCWRNMQLFPAFLLGIKTVRLIINTKAYTAGFKTPITTALQATGMSCTSATLKSLQLKTLNRNIDSVFDDYRKLLGLDNKFISAVDSIEEHIQSINNPGRIYNYEMPFAHESVKYLVLCVQDGATVKTLDTIKSLSIRQGSASDKKVMSDPLNLDELKMYTLNCLQELACDGPIDGYKHNPNIDTSKYIVLNLGVLDTNPGMSFVGYNNYDKYTALQLEIETTEACSIHIFACYDYYWMINKDGTMNYTDKNPKPLSG